MKQNNYTELLDIFHKLEWKLLPRPLPQTSDPDLSRILEVLWDRGFWFLGCFVSGFSVTWFQSFLDSWFRSFEDWWFRSFVASWFLTFLVSTSLGQIFSDPELPQIHFVFSGIFWSDIQDFQSLLKTNLHVFSVLLSARISQMSDVQMCEVYRNAFFQKLIGGGFLLLSKHPGVSTNKKYRFWGSGTCPKIPKSMKLYVRILL